jgi:hypothetical protein
VIVNPDLYEKYRVVINREKFLRVEGVRRIRITPYPSRLPASYPFRFLQPKRNPMISISYGAYFRFARQELWGISPDSQSLRISVSLIPLSSQRAIRRTRVSGSRGSFAGRDGAPNPGEDE